MAQYFSARALQSQRSSGFKSTSNAIAEIVDNAFDADASIVEIYFVERQSPTNNFFSVDEIIICDNGDGMDLPTLQECLTFGKSGNVSEEFRVKQKKLGKFGYGLPNSSLSQCPDTTVYSWQKKNDVYSTNLILKEIIEKDSIDIPAPEKTPFPSHFTDLGVGKKLKSGTVVHWKQCDRLKPKKAKTLVDHSERLLGRIFRYMITDGKIIRFHHFQENRKTSTFSRIGSPKDAIANDPLFLTSESILAPIILHGSKNAPSPEVQEHLKKFAINETKAKPTSYLVEKHTFEPEFYWRGKCYKFQVKSSAAHIDIQKPGVRDGGKTDVGRVYGDKMEFGSISFVRANREIDAGTFKLYKTNETPYRWWSIEVKFDSDLDDLIGVANNKQYIEFENTYQSIDEEDYNEASASLSEAREALWIKLSRILSSAIIDLKKIIKANEKQWKEVNEPSGGVGIPTSTPKTQQATSNTDGKGTQLTKEQKSKLLSVLKKMFPKLSEAQIKKAIANFDKMKCKGILLYAHNDADRLLWSFTEVRGFLVITVNTSHKFYENIIEPLIDAGSENTLASLELFISSLAWSEAREQGGPNKDTLEDFRQATGSHLSRYIRDNDIKLTDLNS